MSGMQFLSGDELRSRERIFRQSGCRNIAPTGGVVSPFGTDPRIRKRRANGVSVFLGQRSRAWNPIAVSCRSILTRAALLRFYHHRCGLYADKVANMAGDYSFTIRPRKARIPA